MQKGGLLKLGLHAQLEQKTHLHRQPHFTSVSACSSPSHPFQGCLGLLLPQAPAQALFSTSNTLTHPTLNLQYCLICLILTTFLSEHHSLLGWTQSALTTDSLQPFHGVRVSLPSLDELFYPWLTPGTLLQRITIELLEHFVPQEPVCLGIDIPMDLCESPAPLLGQHKLQPQLTLQSPWQDRAQPSSGRLYLTAPWWLPLPPCPTSLILADFSRDHHPNKSLSLQSVVRYSWEINTSLFQSSFPNCKSHEAVISIWTAASLGPGIYLIHIQ